MINSEIKVYTLTEAAAYLVVREDDLVALLPDTAIGPDWPQAGFTRADVELLERLIGMIRRLYSESTYGGGDL
jgi:hypothetical protein